ncbi:MAG: hypothetical protein WA364_04520 [Candidatus Nitrosopolaris sp.]
MESKDKEIHELKEQVEEIRDLYLGLIRTLNEAVDLAARRFELTHKIFLKTTFLAKKDRACFRGKSVIALRSYKYYYYNQRLNIGAPVP